MSKYHAIGIDHEGKMQSLTCSDSKEAVLRYAKSVASRFQQLFLVSQGKNVRELKYDLEIGQYAPMVTGTFAEGGF